MLAATAFLACGLTACSDDDEGGSNPQGPVATYNGKLLTSVGNNVTLRYDDKGRCVEATAYNEKTLIDYEKGIITQGNISSMHLDGVEYRVTFNGAGYITSISTNQNESEDGYTYTVSENSSFSYDGSGHLTEITTKYKEAAYGNGESYSSSENSNTIITWKNGQLASYTCKGEDMEDGEKSYYESVINFTAGSTDNKYNQWTTAEEDGIMETEGLGYAGLFGKGSSKLISSYTETYKDDGEREHNDTYNFTFQLNDDGTIHSERMGNGYTHYYEYSLYNDNNNNSKKAQGLRTKPEQKKNSVSLFNIRTRIENLKAKMKNTK